MLHKNKSSKMMYFKFMFIIPALIAFVFTFNTKVIAQQKKVEKIEIHQDLEMESYHQRISKKLILKS